MKRVVAIDFDGTLCHSSYPDLGHPCVEAINFVKFCNFLGIQVILWTCRTGKELNAAVNWCSTYGIYFDAVNENIKERVSAFRKLYPHIDVDSRKVGADIYIDDRNPGGIEWQLVYEWLWTVCTYE